MSFWCFFMVYCTKCGYENVDDSKFCAKCGNALYPSAEAPSERRVEGYRPRRPERDMCFGLPGGFWALLIGFAIVLWGLSEITRIYYRVEIPWWPLIVIIVGLFMVVRAFRHRM